jgi:hypothetical protein
MKTAAAAPLLAQAGIRPSGACSRRPLSRMLIGAHVDLRNG